MRKKSETESAFSPTEALDVCDSFFLVGIGGAGMSAVARLLRNRGYRIAGSDAVKSLEVERLIEEGMHVSIGHNSDAIAEFSREHPSTVGVIVTDAVDLLSNPEVQYSHENGLPVLRRSQGLGWLLRDYKVIAITGTHGKTTTTGLAGAGLIAGGMDPLVVVGASIPEWGGPIHEGNGEFAVVEACEAYDAYQDIEPFIVVLTNLEPDHLDYHGTYENLRDSMVRFVSKVPPEGGLVYCADDRGASEVAELTDVRCLPYGLSEAWLQQVSNKFELGIDAKVSASEGIWDLNLPGDHNRMNATGALAVASLLNNDGPVVDLNLVEHGIVRFTGAERRIQVLLEGSITVIDDYAHHPSEIAATLLALRGRYHDRRVVVVYQPHLYSRTQGKFQEFADALSLADVVYLTDIYPAREAPLPGISSSRIAELVSTTCRYVPSRHLLPRKVAAALEPGDVVVGMGAGNISEFAPDLINEINRAARATDSLSITVAYGGDSSEREVSLHSGQAVAQALTRKGHSVELVDVTELLLRRGSVTRFLGASRPDVVFLAVHGTNSEDGALQGFFELLHLPYTGSGIQASAIAMDKNRTKQLLQSIGIRVPKGVLITSSSQQIPLELPLVVKPNAEGSTVGVTFAHTQEDLIRGIEKALSYDDSVLVEELIQGIEISTPVLNGEPLLPVEIVAKGGVYDFANKYVPGATEEIVPARLSKELLKRAQEIALEAHNALGCEGATRTDAIVRGEEIIVLEVNTLPGMTSTSLLPNSAKASGIPFDDLCQRLVEDALKRYAFRHL